MRVAFIAADNPGGLLIRAFEGGQASHCGIIDGDSVIDATLAHGVQRRTFDDFMLRRRPIETIEVPLPDEDAALRFACAQIDRAYDWTAIVGFMGLRDWSRDEKWYCSELVAASFMAGGLTIADRGARFGVRLTREVAHAHRA